MFKNQLLAVPMMFLFLIAAVPAFAGGPIDETLFTTYQIDSSYVYLSVCGSLPGSYGCYGSGTLGPFGSVGALLEGNASVNVKEGVVTRYIYALDVAAGASGTDVDLLVYKMTDTISPPYATVSVTLFKTISLPLSGGSSALASMAANTKFIFIGTNQSPQSVRLQKSNFAIIQSGSFEPPINVSAITSDKYGYVTVTFGAFSSGDTGFIVYGPDGSAVEDGGGAPVMLSTDQAVLPAALPY